VNFLNQFSIQFAGLALGCYNYNFKVDDSFFDKFAESQVKQGLIDVDIEFEKKSKMLILNFEIKGTVKLMCDRCLDDFDINIQSNERIIVKFGKNEIEETDDIITISEKEHEINVSHYIYEFIHLALPVKRVHSEDNNGISLCNADIIAKLKEHEVIKHVDIDPRWAILNKIKN